MNDVGEQIAKLAIGAATLAWPAFASWLRGRTEADLTSSVAQKVASILPLEGDSAKAERVLRDG
jgi:hypothetical protein